MQTGTGLLFLHHKPVEFSSHEWSELAGIAVAPIRNDRQLRVECADPRTWFGRLLLAEQFPERVETGVLHCLLAKRSRTAQQFIQQHALG